jgi:hypothetical protein
MNLKVADNHDMGEIAKQICHVLSLMSLDFSESKGTILGSIRVSVISSSNYAVVVHQCKSSKQFYTRADVSIKSLIEDPVVDEIELILIKCCEVEQMAPDPRLQQPSGPVTWPRCCGSFVTGINRGFRSLLFVGLRRRGRVSMSMPAMDL